MKNTNRQSNKQNNLSHSDICFLSDDELRKLFISVRTRINKNRRKRLKSRDLEVELCYIQKEIQDRRDSRKNKQTRAN